MSESIRALLSDPLLSANSPPQPHKLTILTYNTNGIKNKTTKILNLISTINPDITVLSETHLAAQLPQNVKFAKVEYTIYKKSTRGVLLATNLKNAKLKLIHKDNKY